MKYFSSVLIIIMLFACSGKLSDQEYYKQAKENYSSQNFEMAVENFKALTEYYPESPSNAEALFMLGFIYANDIKQLDEAKVYYEKFVENYPEHELANSARYELENLGKDINDLPIFKDSEIDSAQERSSKK